MKRPPRNCSLAMRSIFTALLPVILLVSFASAAAAETTDAPRPNILFIFSDDQAFDAVGALGDLEVETPNLDRLARRGTTFSHTYNMGSWSGAVCIASRMMLNSGLSVWRAQADYPRAEELREAGRWWSEHMKSAGYRTYMTGKWHLRADAGRSFDVVRDVRPGMPKDTPESYHRPPAGKDPSEAPWKPWDRSLGGFWQGGTHWSEVVAEHGADFLREAADDSQPFFMYLAFNAPHDPRQSPKEFVERYPADSIEVPDNFLPQYPFAEKIGCGPGLRDEKLAPFPRTPHAVQVHRSEYFALITHMDEQVGRILDALEASGKADNTWIFFTSDHGLAVGNHGLMGKQNQYDHSIRVPFIAVGPGVEAGRVIDEPIYLQDVMPTTLALAGVEPPDHVEFQNLLPLLGGASSRYDAVYGSYLDLQRCVRTRTHKLIVYPAAKTIRLFDLRSDPQEMHDLADSSEHGTLIDELFAELLRLQQQYDDPLDLRKLFPERFRN